MALFFIDYLFHMFICFSQHIKLVALKLAAVVLYLIRYFKFTFQDIQLTAMSVILSSEISFYYMIEIWLTLSNFIQKYRV